MSSEVCTKMQESQDPRERYKISLERFLLSRGKRVTFTKVELSPGCPIGENFVGEISRVQVNGLIRGADGKEEAYSDSFILKRIPHPDSINHKFFNCKRMFDNETIAYEAVIRSFEDVAGHSLDECFASYYGRAEDFIALEDLKRKGYQMGDRVRGFNVQECSLVLEKLSFFHGVSFAMKSARSEAFSDLTMRLRETVFCREVAEGVVGVYWENAVKMAVRSLRERGKDDRAILTMTGYLGSVLLGLADVIKPEEPFDVVCHGDLWTNNILLRYKNGEATDIRMVDLQTMRHGSCVLDVMHFLFTSLKTDLLTEGFDHLLDVYYTRLTDCLNGFDVPVQFSLNDLREEFKRRIRYGLCVACLVFTFVTRQEPDSGEENVPTKEELSAEEAVDRTYNSLNDLYHKRLYDLVTALTTLDLM